MGRSKSVVKRNAKTQPIERKIKSVKPPRTDGLVYVGGLDRDKLLHALWFNASPTNFYIYAVLMKPEMPDSNEFYIEQAREKDVRANGYVDYTFGRLIKSKVFDLTTDWIDADEYDKEWGKGSFTKVVNHLRRGKLVYNKRPLFG